MKKILLTTLMLLSMCLGISAETYPSVLLRAKGTSGTCYWYITDTMYGGELVIAPLDEVNGELADWSNSSSTSPWWSYANGIYKAVIKPGVKAKTCKNMFYSCNYMKSCDLSGLNTDDVTDMSSMFASCRSLQSIDLSNINTDKVTNMNRMFSGCWALTSLDVSKLNTSNVTDMNSMFRGCKALTSLDVSNFNTSKVTNMEYMFDECNALTSLDLRNFDTSNVTSMYYMFQNCNALTSLDVSKFNTSNVIDMRYMFSNCTSLSSLDIRNFDTANVLDIDRMFNQCTSLKSLDLSCFDTQVGRSIQYILFGCSALESVNLTGFYNPATDYNELNYNYFSNCNKLTSIISNSTTPSVIPDNFFNTLPTLQTCTLYVPAESKALYAAADGWKHLINVADYVESPDDNNTGNNIANNGGNTGIWAALVDENGQQIDCTDYTLGVIVGDEPRTEAKGKATYVGNNPIYRFEVVVPGDDIDEGKEMLFVLLAPDGKARYIVTPSANIKYNNEATYGTPSQPITFKFVKPTSISASGEIHVNVGESVKLGQYLTVSPAGANIPYLDWQTNPLIQESISIDYESADDAATGNATLTGQFPRVTPLSVKPYISGAEGITFPKNKSLTVYVDQPIESLSLGENNADGIITLYADQQITLDVLSTQLTEILGGCYTVTPSTATETPVWTSGNNEVITKDAQGNWNILTTGECVMTLTAANGASVSVTVKIVRRVDSINAFDGTLRLVVGDDVSYLHQAYEVLPANATDKSVTIDVITNSQVLLIDPVNNVAIAPGQGTFRIKSNDNPQYVAHIPFVIEPKLEINVPSQPLAFTTENDDITDDVLASVSITNGNARYAMWTSNNSDAVSINMNEEIPELMDITVNGEGSATITVSVNQHRTTVTGPGINGLSNVEVPVSKTFVINVTAGLTGFQFGDVLAEVGEWVDFTATPVPADASFDVNDVEIYFVDDATGDVDTEHDKVSLWGGYGNSYTAVPNRPVKGKLVTYYKGVSLGEAGSASFNAGQGVTPVEGWDWVSTFASDVNDIYSIYGDNLVEARSLSNLLYNDPVYGYFGSLEKLTKVMGYKVKNAEDGEKVIIPSDGSYDKNAETPIALPAGYSWIGCPYSTGIRYNNIFPLYDVFVSQAQEGDMIISQNDGFAEYDGEYWIGDLEGIEPGKGYVYYNCGQDKTVMAPAETSMYEEGLAKSRSAVRTDNDDVWQYNSRAFANNMPVIARISNIDNADQYSIGAFVGDECRGRGKFINGKFFITVHGEKGDDVHFMLHDKFTGEFIAIQGNVSMAGRAGSLVSPVSLSADMTATGINAAEVSKAMKGVNYNIAGQRVGDNAKGVVISKGYKTVKAVKK